MRFNDMTYREISAVLSELGFNDITEALTDDLERQWNDMPEFVLESMNKLTMLLSIVGNGHYDFETWKWTPGSADVYSFDVEAMDMPNMYKNMFAGIAAISGGELEFCEICQNDAENGASREISFKFNGQKYAYETDQCGDWYDVRIFNLLNDAIAEKNMSKKLYFTTDGYQQFIVFYNDDEWAKRFMKTTGVEIHSEIC